jgi:type I site-specific restriction endonuclease
VHLIDWKHPEKNDFALAEEVTLKGGYERRPDIVLYVNGLAIAVIELKRSSVEIGDGVRQLITNQEEIFNKAFFSTVQLVFAGSDSQGLRYGTTGTPEQFFVDWKDEAATGAAPAAGALLDRPLAQMCSKARLLDLIRNFIIFDAGQKKVPRPHQFFGVKAAQERIAKREGGVIWHTQGSGKSIVIVLLAKWILEHDPEARVLVVTDRDELDKQIEGASSMWMAFSVHTTTRLSSRLIAPIASVIGGHRFDSERQETNFRSWPISTVCRTRRNVSNERKSGLVAETRFCSLHTVRKNVPCIPSIGTRTLEILGQIAPQARNANYLKRTVLV